MDKYSVESSKANIRQEKQKEYNNRSKAIAKMIGENMLWYVCALIPIVLIGFIWSEVSFPTLGWNLLSDAIVTIALFLIAEKAAAELGLIGGKMDEEYIVIHEAYLSQRKTIYKIGILLMDAFCLWQVDVEYEVYMRRRCKKIGIKLEDFESTYKNMPFDELKAKFGALKAGKIEALKGIEPIELTPEILLTDGRAGNDRGGVTESGMDYYDKKTKAWQHILMVVGAALLTASFTVLMTNDISFARVMYTVCKLIMLALRMYTGYSKGAKAFNTVEVLHIESKIKYFNLYLEYLDQKIYKTFGDKYGDISFMESENITADNSAHNEYEKDNRQAEINTCGA